MTKHITISSRAKTCGQACVAMIVGAPLEVITAQYFYHQTLTNPVELSRVLHRLGYHTPEELLAVGAEALPADCLLKCTRGRQWHWALRLHGKTHDPRKSSQGTVLGKIVGVLPITKIRQM